MKRSDHQQPGVAAQGLCGTRGSLAVTDPAVVSHVAGPPGRNRSQPAFGPTLLQFASSSARSSRGGSDSSSHVRRGLLGESLEDVSMAALAAARALSKLTSRPWN